MYWTLLFTHCFVECFVAELELIKPKSKKKQTTSPSLRWIRTPSGAMKINVDVALSKKYQKRCSVAIARDEEGTFLGASPLVLDGLSEAEVAEALACREDLALADDLGFQIESGDGLC